MSNRGRDGLLSGGVVGHCGWASARAQALCSGIAGIVSSSSSHPRSTLYPLQVVELQEAVDAQLVAAGQGASPLRKAWRRRCLAQIGMCVQDAFAPLLQQCSQLMAAGENTDRRVREILAAADGFVDQVSGWERWVGRVWRTASCGCADCYACPRSIASLLSQFLLPPV